MPAPFAITTVLVGAVAAVTYAAVTGVANWAQLVVLGGIALVTIAALIAVDPLRRER